MQYIKLAIAVDSAPVQDVFCYVPQTGDVQLILKDTIMGKQRRTYEIDGVTCHLCVQRAAEGAKV